MDAAEQLAKENRNLAQKIADWLRKWVRSIRAAMQDLKAERPESRAMLQYAQELQKLWDDALVAAARNNQGLEADKVQNQARMGTDEESGRPIYRSNFPKGTPKAAKADHILNLIQNVWSKKPIPLIVHNPGGTMRTIEAQFDPTYSAERGVQTDARKIMGGNRHGNAAEQRVTLDLADDYYEIAEGSTYNYSKAESGKDSSTHQGVKQWHYFVNDILFQEYGEKETTPFRVTINVKERGDGSFVYSFSAEKQKERPSIRRTLHADDTNSEGIRIGNAQPSAHSIRSSSENSQEENSGGTKYSKRDSAGRELTEAQRGVTKQNQQRESRISDRDYSYNALTSKPDMVVTTVNDRVKYKPTSEVRKNILEWGIANGKKVGRSNENGNAVVRVKDTGEEVILSKAGLRHGLDRRFTVNAPVILQAGEILQNAVRINELTPKKDTVDASYVLVGAAKNKNNEPYIVQFVVNRSSNEVTAVDVLYAINAKKEPAALLPEITGAPATLTGSTISISNLLDYVNRYCPDGESSVSTLRVSHDASSCDKRECVRTFPLSYSLL